MASSLDLTKTFTSFAGVDIKVILNGHHAGSMQAISYAIQREKAPIYVMGTVDPISFSRGKRGIAGTMISLMMNYHMLYSNSFEKEAAYLDKGELFGEYVRKSDGLRNTGINDATSEGSLYRELIGSGTGGAVSPTGDRSKKFDLGTQSPNRLNINEQWVSDYAESDLASNYQVAKVFYMDQILPFDVVIHAANEYGHTAQMRLFGCEILNEGSGFSIDDMVIENQMTYVCRTLLPWSPISSVAWANMRSTNAQETGSSPDAGIPPSTPQPIQPPIPNVNARPNPNANANTYSRIFDAGREVYNYIEGYSEAYLKPGYEAWGDLNLSLDGLFQIGQGMFMSQDEMEGKRNR